MQAAALAAPTPTSYLHNSGVMGYREPPSQEPPPEAASLTDDFSPANGVAESPPSRKRKRPVKSRTDVAYPRKRATSACNLCRARKIKCNNARPSCSSCLAAGAACVYGDSQDQSRYIECIHRTDLPLMQLTSFDPASILILDRLDQVLHRLDHGSAPQTRASTTTSPQLPEFQSIGTSTPRENQLRIPAQRTTADAVLQWGVFGSRYPDGYLSNAVFDATNIEDDSDPEVLMSQQHLTSKTRGSGINEDAIPGLVQRFLDLVHTKNPILDVGTITAYARHCAEFGLGWDPSSCLVVSVSPYKSSAVASRCLRNPSLSRVHLVALHNLSIWLLQAQVLRLR